MIECRVQANKRISCYHPLDNHTILGNLRGLLEHGIQVLRDVEEVRDKVHQGIHWLCWFHWDQPLF